MAELPPLPTLPITSEKTLQKCRSLSVGPKDVFICSFPKSGTTWMQNIVFQLLRAERALRRQDTDELPLDHISQYAPFYEIDPHWEPDSDQLVARIREAHDALGYRLFNTHLRWDMLPCNEQDSAKYIYLVRDGRDVLTSFYHHMINQHVDDGGFEGDFDSFFQSFLEGNVAYGKWSHHLASWMPLTRKENNNNKTNPPIILVRYEDLKADLPAQVSRIVEFLELPRLPMDATGAMDRVLDQVSFEYMRKNQHLFHPISVRWKEGFSFIREGSVGDHNNIFDEKHKAKFMESVRSDFQGEIPDWLKDIGFV